MREADLRKYRSNAGSESSEGGGEDLRTKWVKRATIISGK